LRALAAGESTNSIAGELFISLATVRNHVRAILRKLEVNTRLEAVLIWVSQFR
jgi:DNA-binding NarL/FixJ family response regulator